MVVMCRCFYVLEIMRIILRKGKLLCLWLQEIKKLISPSEHLINIIKSYHNRSGKIK